MNRTFPASRPVLTPPVVWRFEHLLLRAMIVLTVALLNGAVPASGAWQSEFAVGSIQVRSEVDAAKIQPAISQIPFLKQALAETLRIEIVDHPIELLIFSSAGNYRNYVRPRVPEGANRPALFVKGPDVLWVYVTYGSGWETNLRHEMTHAYLHSSLPFVPLWLDEGLAKYFELPARDQGLQRDYVSNLNWRYRLRQSPRSTALQELGSLAEFRPEHYRDSWAWVYFCLHSSPESRQLLQSYLLKIQAEDVPGPFFRLLAAELPQSHERAREFFRTVR